MYLQIKNYVTSKDSKVKEEYQKRWHMIEEPARIEIKKLVSLFTYLIYCVGLPVYLLICLLKLAYIPYTQVGLYDKKFKPEVWNPKSSMLWFCCIY